MNILAIETSCDDTGIALIKGGPQGCRILSNVVSSQIKLHAPYGGVVPNLAARAHLENIKPILKEALKQADNPKIDLIAVTIGPGLIPSLLIGTNFAKALAYAWRKPIIGLNHIEGHIYANWLTKNGKFKGRPFGQVLASPERSPQRPSLPIELDFPILCLIVSGGHTQLILMKEHGKYQLLGETRDDAAGEAFDKVAKLLNLGYPGGPIISQRAQKGNPRTFNLPRPMLKTKDFDFSFSGLKTAVLYLFKEQEQRWSWQPRTRFRQDHEISRFVFVSNICASFQQAVIDVLVSKTIQAAKKYKVKSIMLSGGVAANQELRQQMSQTIRKEFPSLNFHIPKPEFCTDNGAMIGAAAFYKKQKQGLLADKTDWPKIQAEANLKLVA
jgi:N6-L-threonylcarbamoyladenine synthase